MLIKDLLIIAAVAVVLCFALGLAVEPAMAQGNPGADRSLAERESGQLATKEWDQSKMPGKLEMGLALGSIAVLIAVFKWL